MSNNKKLDASQIAARNVEWTSDYEVFSRLKGNREVDPLHVATLVKAMQKKYRFSPILVNQNFEVIDGQHRLEAHKRLGLAVPFCWEEGGELEDVQQLNSTQKAWTNNDYMESFIARGYKDYEVYKWFKETYKLPHIVCVALLASENKGLRKRFINGEFKVVNLELAKAKATILTQLEPYFTHWRDAGFLRAMNTALTKKGFDVQTFIHKVAINPSMLQPCVSVDQYLTMIEEVYNFRSVKKIPIKYGEDDPHSKWMSDALKIAKAKKKVAKAG